MLMCVAFAFSRVSFASVVVALTTISSSVGGAVFSLALLASFVITSFELLGSSDGQDRSSLTTESSALAIKMFPPLGT